MIFKRGQRQGIKKPQSLLCKTVKNQKHKATVLPWSFHFKIHTGGLLRFNTCL